MSIFLDKTDTATRELLIQLVEQKKEQQDQIKSMNLVLEEVLARQTIIVNKLHATEMPWRVNPKEKSPLKLQVQMKTPRKQPNSTGQEPNKKEGKRMQKRQNYNAPNNTAHNQLG